MSFDGLIRREIERRIELYRRAKDDVGLQDALYERCRRDPLFWARNFAWQFDDRRKIKKIPWLIDELSFQIDLMDLFLMRGPYAFNPDGRPWKVATPKCRDMGGSYTVLSAMVWAWQFDPGSHYGLISRKEEEVDNGTEKSLFGKLRYIIKSQPKWMRPPGYEADSIADRHKYHDKYMCLINPEHDNTITGTATTDDAFSSRRYKRVFVDEAAKIPNLRQILNSLHDVSPGLWLCSSAKGYEHFAQTCSGDGVEAMTYEDLKRGKVGYGWLVYWIKHTLDPRKDEAWMRAEQASRTREAFAQEVLIDFHASAPGLIWSEFHRQRHLLDEDEWKRSYLPHLSRAKLIEGWDFGSGPSLTAVVWAAYFEKEDILAVIDYHVWHEAHYKDVARDVGAAGWMCNDNPRGRRPDLRVGDPAMSARGSDQRSWRVNLRECGIKLRNKRRELETSLDRVRTALRDGRIVFAPACARRVNPDLPSLVESIQQYRRRLQDRRETVKDYVGGTPKPLEDQYSHLCDAFAYICEWLPWGQPPVRMKHGR